MDPAFITTAFELPGCRIVRNLGIVRGITVRSRSVVGNFIGGIEAFFGGFGSRITVFTDLCEQARGEAFDLLIQHADAMGANAVIGMRYDANEIAAAVKAEHPRLRIALTGLVGDPPVLLDILASRYRETLETGA